VGGGRSPSWTVRLHRVRRLASSRPDDAPKADERDGDAITRSAHLIAVGYELEETAERALAALGELAKEGSLELKDAAVVVKDDAGRVELRQTQLAAGETVVSGGSIGLLLGLAVGMPVAAALIGLAGGGGLAAFHRGISDKRMRKFGEELPPGHAALFALVAKVDWGLLHDRLAPYGGEVAASELDDAVVASLESGSTGP
jgi:uncharacterized membrane protein